MRQALTLPDTLGEGVYKCRVVYGLHVEQVTFTPYTPRPVSSLRLVTADKVAYAYKYEDRSALNALFALRGTCDDVLLVRHGLLTDTSYANIALWNGRQWVTPDAPLLHGTMRAFLLKNKILVPKPIPLAELGQYQKIRLFNALLGWEHAPEVAVGAVQVLCY